MNNDEYLGSHYGAVVETLANIEQHRPDLFARLEPDIWSWQQTQLLDFAAARATFNEWEDGVRARLGAYAEAALAAGAETGRAFLPVGLDEAVKADDLSTIDRLLSVAPTPDRSI